MAVSNEPVSIQSVSKTEPIDQTRQLGDDLSQHVATESMHQCKRSQGIQELETSSQADASNVQRQETEANHPRGDAGPTLAEETVVQAGRRGIEHQGAFQPDHHRTDQHGVLQADRHSIEQQVAELEHRLGSGNWTRCVDNSILLRSFLLTL